MASLEARIRRREKEANWYGVRRRTSQVGRMRNQTEKTGAEREITVDNNKRGGRAIEKESKAFFRLRVWARGRQGLGASVLQKDGSERTGGGDPERAEETSHPRLRKRNEC